MELGLVIAGTSANQVCTSGPSSLRQVRAGLLPTIADEHLPPHEDRDPARPNVFAACAELHYRPAAIGRLRSATADDYRQR